MAQAGQVVQVEPELALRVLYPPPQLLHGTHSDINNSSVVLRLEYGTIRMLLTGDIETEAGRELLDAESGDLNAQVLKVPHHGSSTGLSPELLAAIHPAVALISVGAKNTYGHPAPDTLRLLHDAGVTTYRTDLQGTIELLSDGRQVWARPEHP
jgi:competence protein ComEC